MHRQPGKRRKNRHSPQSALSYKAAVSADVIENINHIKQILQSPSDLTVRVFTFGQKKLQCGTVCIDGLSDRSLINDHILQSMRKLQYSPELGSKNMTADEFIVVLENEVLSAHQIEMTSSLDKIIGSVLSGDTVLFVEGSKHALIVESKNWPRRALEEPSTEALIRGPRDGFTESIETNTALIRRHLHDPALRMETMKVGNRSKKNLVITYIEGIVHPDLVKEVRRRLESFDMDIAPESGFIEEWIEDSFLSPFPTLLHTERPDKTSAALSQGKVAILLDGSPFVLIAPATFGNLLQSPEDYYERWMVGTLLRILRYAAAFCAVFLPGLYIALVSFHPGMIPSKLAFSIAATREGLPFPAAIEAIVMITVLEFLREAGIRLPKPIGQTIGIVGGLVIGEAAVTAGIVSPVMVIVVALTAIASFAVPAYSIAISFRLIVYGMMLAASIFGLYGLVLGYIVLNIHLVNLKSFGIPYSTPFAPNLSDDWKDLILRAPIVTMRKRPEMMQTKDEQRINNGGSMR